MFSKSVVSTFYFLLAFAFVANAALVEKRQGEQSSRTTPAFALLTFSVVDSVFNSLTSAAGSVVTQATSAGTLS